MGDPKFKSRVGIESMSSLWDRIYVNSVNFTYQLTKVFMIPSFSY